MSRSACSVALGILTLALVACGPLLGIDEYAILPQPMAGSAARSTAAPECTTNRECTSRVDPDRSAGSPSVCLKASGQCVPLLSEDCSLVTGDFSNDDAIVIGSLFSVSGPQANTNIPRQQSAMLAVEEINAAGGIPSGTTSAGGRPLVLVSCDETANLLRAGSHLIDELKVPAIIGPNTSQDTLDLSNRLSITSGALVISPTAVASSIADLLDNDLTWQMIPTDVQRAPLMIQEVNALETRLRAERNREHVRLSVIFRDDALGQGTRLSIAALTFNGAPLSDASNLGNSVRIDPYEPNKSNQREIVDATIAFAPDIVILAGTAETISQLMLPLEQGWTSAQDQRPEYVLIDSAKVPELLAAVTGNDDLRRRIRGTGVTPNMRSVAVNDAFVISYRTRYPGSNADIFGMGPSYDATYAIAYAIASLRDAPITGASIAGGMRRLSDGATSIDLVSNRILAAFRALAEGESISVVGTFSALRWNDRGAALGGLIELWCVGNANGKPVYGRSGLTIDIVTGQAFGLYTQCAP